jgi:DNA-binding response OmpR family regulator
MAKHKILLIDDESDIRECLCILVGDTGNYEFDQAGDGAEGLRKILTSDYDCVVSDIKMPGLDGVSMLKQVRAAGKDVPVVFISAFADEQFDFALTQYGAVKLIHKLDLKDVAGRVQEAIRVGEDSQAMLRTDPMANDFLSLLNNRK